jgi:hypothetical protein
MSKQGSSDKNAEVAKGLQHGNEAVPATQLEALTDFSRRYRSKIGKSKPKALDELRAMGIVDDKGQVTPGFGGLPPSETPASRRAR